MASRYRESGPHNPTHAPEPASHPTPHPTPHPHPHPSHSNSNSPLPPHRFGPSTLHQRDARSSLFANYAGDRSRPSSSGNNPSHSPASGSGGYGYGYGYGVRGSGGGGGLDDVNGDVKGNGGLGYRPATPNSRSVFVCACLGTGPQRAVRLTASPRGTEANTATPCCPSWRARMMASWRG